jgi:hypothetical protein
MRRKVPGATTSIGTGRALPQNESARGAILQTSSPPPAGYQPQRFSKASKQNPMWRNAGKYALAKKSNEGDHSTCVPPRRVSEQALSAKAWLQLLSPRKK